MVAAAVDVLVGRALPGRRIVAVERIGADRGVFSEVHRVRLDAGDPPSVVVKVPSPGPNGDAAATAGAYEREGLAYRQLLPASPVAVPGCHLVAEEPGRRVALVLEDLTPLRSVDQLQGLTADDAAAVTAQLAALHRHWSGSRQLDVLDVRRAAPATFDPAALARGHQVVHRRADELGAEVVRALDAVLARRANLVQAFTDAGPVTLCHGDPRADNVAFATSGAVLFDWQQLAVQFPEADLAWLAATSLEPQERRRIERDLVDDHARRLGSDPDAAWDRYRLGMVLPGLAVLLLVQRQVPPGRGAAMVATSTRRILRALHDLDVAALGR